MQSRLDNLIDCVRWFHSPVGYLEGIFAPFMSTGAIAVGNEGIDKGFK